MYITVDEKKNTYQNTETYGALWLGKNKKLVK